MLAVELEDGGALIGDGGRHAQEHARRASTTRAASRRCSATSVPEPLDAGVRPRRARRRARPRRAPAERAAARRARDRRHRPRVRGRDPARRPPVAVRGLAPSRRRRARAACYAAIRERARGAASRTASSTAARACRRRTTCASCASTATTASRARACGGDPALRRLRVEPDRLLPARPDRRPRARRPAHVAAPALTPYAVGNTTRTSAVAACDRVAPRPTSPNCAAASGTSRPIATSSGASVAETGPHRSRRRPPAPPRRPACPARAARPPPRAARARSRRGRDRCGPCRRRRRRLHAATVARRLGALDGRGHERLRRHLRGAPARVRPSTTRAMLERCPSCRSRSCGGLHDQAEEARVALAERAAALDRLREPVDRRERRAEVVRDRGQQGGEVAGRRLGHRGRVQRRARAAGALPFRAWRSPARASSSRAAPDGSGPSSPSTSPRPEPDVCITHRRTDPAATLERVRAHGVAGHAVPADLADPTAAEAAVHAAAELLDGLDGDRPRRRRPASCRRRSPR